MLKGEEEGQLRCAKEREVGEKGNVLPLMLSEKNNNIHTGKGGMYQKRLKRTIPYFLELWNS